MAYPLILCDIQIHTHLHMHQTNVEIEMYDMIYLFHTIVHTISKFLTLFFFRVIYITNRIKAIGRTSYHQDTGNRERLREASLPHVQVPGREDALRAGGDDALEMPGLRRAPVYGREEVLRHVPHPDQPVSTAEGLCAESGTGAKEQTSCFFDR